MKTKLQILFTLAFVGFLTMITLSGNHRVEASYGQSELIGGSEGYFTAVIYQTGTKVFDGAGVVYRIDLASAPNENINTYVQCIDTGSSDIGTTYFNYSTGSKITPAIVFQASVTVNGQAMYKDYGPYGIRISSGLFVYKSAAASGESLRATVYWRR